MILPGIDALAIPYPGWTGWLLQMPWEIPGDIPGFPPENNIMVQVAPVAGPFAVSCHGSGPGFVGWFTSRAPTAPHQAWTITCWVRPTGTANGSCLIAGFGDGINLEGGQRFLALQAGRVGCWLAGTTVDTGVVLESGQWRHLAAEFDGQWTLRVLVDGVEYARQAVHLTRAGAQVRIAPPPPFADGRTFCGDVRDCQVFPAPLGEACLAALVAQGPGATPLDQTPDLPTPDNRSDNFQSNRGLGCPQDPATFPGVAPLPLGGTSQARTLPRPQAAADQDGRLVLDRGWELGDGDGVSAQGSEISTPGFATGLVSGPWYDATVPGTILTTLVDQGVYPDPLLGLNNLLIPDDLALRPWWYRTEFTPPAAWRNRHVRLLLHGINYHAEIWLNGKRLGEITGAFRRGIFDLSPLQLTTGTNALAIRIWPQPHPGLTSEASRHVGPLPNGGEGTLDGPTFFCSEGWDWIPTIRDRNTGLWQGVELLAGGPVTVADPQVITELPDLPDLGRARLTIRAEVRNRSAQRQAVLLEGTIAGASFALPLDLTPGEERTISVDADRFPALELQDPSLWWPNGHGEPVLHDLVLRLIETTGDESDRCTVRIGLRTVAWSFAPHLVLRVNGRRVPCLGGNWGMDDALKRISRARLEPYMRLHRDANLTMIRNWCGQSTSAVFFELCDEYGLLVWNDFWMSTEGYNLPPLDTELLLANADDTVRRFRHHACIVIWCGRNEGKVPPSLDRRLASLLDHRDGTRHYESSSCDSSHLLPSGPWQFQEPETYFTTHSQGFTTELGITSIPTAEAMRAMLPPGQEWPLTEAWTYHDLHCEHAGDSRPYLRALAQRYGVSTDLDGFCARAQMLNYVHHRGMYEGCLGKLWQPASGLLAWMSHPCWPSTSWQFYSHDYEAHAAFAGVRRACEPVHVQWNLPDSNGEARIAVVNRTAGTLAGCQVTAAVHALDGRLLGQREWPWVVAADGVAEVGRIPWGPTLTSPVQFLALTLTEANGRRRSRNIYWRAEHNADLAWLQTMPKRQVPVHAVRKRHGAEVVTTIHLANPGPDPLVLIHVSLRRNADGSRVLPAFTSDNYQTLMPDEEQVITISSPAHCTPEAVHVWVEGWNIIPHRVEPV